MTTETKAGTVRSADGTTIAFERTGEGPALIFVDAAGCYRDFGSLRPLAQLLTTDFTVLTYDRRGRGASTDRPPYVIDREIEDIAALVAESGGAAYLYGNSSGALLALQAAASGLRIPKLALFEPPLGGPAGDDGLARELTALVAADRRWGAASRFLQVIAVPREIVAQMDASSRDALAAVAQTLAYDCQICHGTTVDLVASVTAPTLVIDSEASSRELAGWAAYVAEALPNGTHRSLAGEWHGVPDSTVAPVVSEFLLG